MLRITVQEEPNVLTLKLEGRIADQSFKEFESTWQKLSGSLGSRKLCLDIRGMTFISAEGRKLLARIHEKSHNDFRANTPLTTFVAQEATHHRNTQDEER